MSQVSNRSFVANDLVFNWESLDPIFNDLQNRSLNSLSDLKHWLKDQSELSAILEEEFAWRYIRMNIDTENEDYQNDFQYFVQEIHPKIAPFEDILNRRLNESRFKSELDGPGYKILLRNVASQIEIFREENIPLFTALSQESQEYGAISAKMTIQYEGEEYTLQQASKFLKNTNREIRKEVFDLIQVRRSKDIVSLNLLFDKLIEKRQQVALNADFENYRDYMFKSMGRFDYGPKDCFDFHDSIKTYFVPLEKMVAERRKSKMGLDVLKPWDLTVDPDGLDALKPFQNGDELLEKAIACFQKIDPFFSDCLIEMKKRKHLDLDSKKGKAPGGFNYPLYESGYPFIFMNAAGNFRDVTTMLHEGGHAIHSVLSHSLELTEFKSLTSEIAELASMSMELISMDHWDVFFDNEEDLKRAKRDQILDIVRTLPWVATIDKFQHWIYTNKNHTVEERYNYWLSLSNEFGTDLVDWSGYEEGKKNQWQRQLHLFEVPFYYIEYGMAQLGAIAIWRNYKKDPKTTIRKYKEALALGYTKTIGEIYETAGIAFDFSKSYVKELSEFLKEEIEKIN